MSEARRDVISQERCQKPEEMSEAAEQIKHLLTTEPHFLPGPVEGPHQTMVERVEAPALLAGPASHCRSRWMGGCWRVRDVPSILSSSPPPLSCDLVEVTLFGIVFLVDVHGATVLIARHDCSSQKAIVFTGIQGALGGTLLFPSHCGPSP